MDVPWVQLWHAYCLHINTFDLICGLNQASALDVVSQLGYYQMPLYGVHYDSSANKAC